MSWSTRRLVDSGAFVVMVLGTLWGTGVFGTPVERSSGGALAANATLIAPATPAFAIWSVIYGLLAGYVVWLWLPGSAASGRARGLDWLPALSMVLNGAWLGITQLGLLWLSVVDIAALTVILGMIMKRLAAEATRGLAEAILLDGTFGLYLGWVSVATCANVTAVLVAQGVDPGPGVSELLAVVVLAVAAAIGVMLARTLGVTWGVPAAMAWGLCWIAVGRLSGDPSSPLVGWAAVASAAVVVAAFALAFRRGQLASG